MGKELKKAGKEVGLGVLNLIFVVGLLSVLVQAKGRIAERTLLIVAVIVGLTAYIGGTRWIEGRIPAELVGSSGLGEFAAGLGIGLALFSAVICSLWLVGAYHLGGWGGAVGAVDGALVTVTAAVIEETLFRGFLFRLVEIVAGTWIAVLVTSMLFGAAHAFNTGATITSSIAISLEAGVLLGAAYALTGRLWFPIGLHAGWNVAESSIFGLAMSGFANKSALLAEGNLQGATFLTGGAFGPEASAFAVVICFAFGLLLLWRTKRLNRVQRPAWNRGNSSTQAMKTGFG